MSDQERPLVDELLDYAVYAPLGLALTIVEDLPSLVAGLPDKQRQVVMLFYMEEKSYEEVSRLLDMPVGTVKTHLHRARKELALRWRKEHTDAVRGV